MLLSIVVAVVVVVVVVVVGGVVVVVVVVAVVVAVVVVLSMFCWFAYMCYGLYVFFFVLFKAGNRIKRLTFIINVSRFMRLPACRARCVRSACRCRCPSDLDQRPEPPSSNPEP